MNIQGSRERVLDSVVPHEVTHTIFASYFRCPLPRWADEGACTTMEDQSEIAKQEQMQFEPVTRGRFEKSEPTIVDGQDLDVPTFLRRNVKVK